MRTRLVAVAFASFLAVALTTAGCGKSVEGETKAWSASKLDLEKFAGKFPGLKDPINKHIAEAKTAFDAAQQLADEDAKTKGMSAANLMLTQVLNPIRALDKAMLDVEALKKDPGVLSLSAGDVNPAMKLADVGLEKAAAMLDGKGVDTSGALVGKIEEATRLVNNGAAELRTLKDRVAGAQASADKASADKASADKAAADKAAADKAAADKAAADKTVHIRDEPAGGTAPAPADNTVHIRDEPAPTPAPAPSNP